MKILVFYCDKNIATTQLRHFYVATVSQGEASAAIKARAAQISGIDQPKFIEAVETELLALHEGNFARYYIRPSQFARWKEVWNK